MRRAPLRLLIATATVSAVTLAGCSSAGSTDSPSTPNSSAAPSSSAAAAPGSSSAAPASSSAAAAPSSTMAPDTNPPAQQGTLTIYSQWKEGQPGQVLMQSVADDFTKATGTPVKFIWKGNDVSASLVPTLNTDNVPADMVETSNAQIKNILHPTGGLMDLAAVYGEKAEGSDKTIGELVGEGGKLTSTVVDETGKPTAEIVTIPYWASARGIWFYNGAEHPDLIGKEPKSWEDLWALLGKLKEEGKAPIAHDGSVASYTFEFYGNILRSLEGQDAQIKAYNDKTGATFEGANYVKAAEIVAEIAAKGYFLEGFDASKFPEEENRWANNEAVFNVNGSWLPAEVAKIAAPDFQYKSFLFPGVGGKAPGLNWDTSGFAIMKNTKNADAAKKFAGFALQAKYQERVATEMGMLPLAPGAAVPDQVAPVKAAIDSGKDLLPPVPAGYGDWQGKAVFPVTTKLLLGTLPAKDFAATMKQSVVDYWKSQG